MSDGTSAWGGTSLFFVRGYANAVSGTVPFLFHFFWKKTPFLLQFFGKNHAVFLANFAKMYPFLNKIVENWRIAPKILRIVVE